MKHIKTFSVIALSIFAIAAFAVGFVPSKTIQLSAEPTTRTITFNGSNINPSSETGNHFYSSIKHSYDGCSIGNGSFAVVTGLVSLGDDPNTGGFIVTGDCSEIALSGDYMFNFVTKIEVDATINSYSTDLRLNTYLHSFSENVHTSSKLVESPSYERGIRKTGTFTNVGSLPIFGFGFTVGNNSNSYGARGNSLEVVIHSITISYIC